MSLMHNIRNWAEFQLQGVIPWSRFSFPDEVHTDTANCSIEGKAGLYRIAVTSSYATPPLGNVKFRDHASGHEIEGNNQDGTWHQIAEYLKAREAGEGAPYQAATPVLADVIAKANAPVVHLPVNELPIPPVPMVWFIADPGVWYQNGPALVTRVNADGSYNLTVVPDGSEPFYRNNVRERSDGLRNVCWVAYPVAITIAADSATSDAAIDVNTEIADLKTAVSELTETISRLKASAFDQRKSA